MIPPENPSDLLKLMSEGEMLAYSVSIGPSKVGGTHDTVIEFALDSEDQPMEKWVELEKPAILEFLREAKRYSSVMGFDQPADRDYFKVEAVVVDDGPLPKMFDEVIKRLRNHQ